ncbi:hypothetical protein [Algoriphagus halophytocola]|uniref:Uncharacterized protein n=1 Tax=Algoriphagus halophytocola TaxID=2991499 RepID=A0ABY6MCC0_9BACT|nr:hypothetical protein [Algoriphagus sp. TR-M5]UZD21336.1 hypothetical protein OM944_11730 [Algoriphagus sp. TR-M5]
MKTCALLLSLFIFFSCNPKANSGDKIKTDEPERAEALATENPPAKEDPDPTDDIAAEEYLLPSSSMATAAIVKESLQRKFKADIEKNILEKEARKFVQFEYDLNADGTNEILVGLVGPYFCGSGGCTQFVMDHEGKIITTFTVSDYPVVIDKNKTNGWNDLFIRSDGEYRIIKFDGSSYPSNPSLEPALGTIPGDGLPRALDFIHDKYPWFRF